jgi:hypothetical protein
MRMDPILVVILALLVGGCGPREQGGGEAPLLLPSLQVYTAGGDVGLVLQVTNTAAEPVGLNFRTGQSYDFVVRDGEREIWRWSDDQMFTQALRQEELAPSASLRFEATWRPPPGLEGEFEVVGLLTATDHPLGQSTRIRLP